MLAAAAVWAGLDGEATAQGSAAADRAALEAFYDATDGPSWTDDTYWRTSAPPGEWFGVTTDAGGRVTELELPGNGLTGPIPDALGDLALLRTLNLGSRFDYDAQRWIENELTGSIPVALGRLANLRWLSLNGNALVGPIPAWFRSLTNLRALYLDSVGLTGPVPAEFESLANLQTLSLASNGLTGSIPTWLGNLADLRALSLASNGLTGPIPARLGDLANLRRLSLAWNPLTGILPRTLAGLLQLTTLNIEATAACAPADDEYQAWLASIDFRGDTCNRAPEPVGAVPPHSLVESGPAAGVPMEAYFSDPDDDPLTYSAASSRAGTVTALVSGDTVWLAPGSAGTATVSVTAEDPDGLTAAQTIDVTTIASAGPQNDREVLEVFYDSTGGEGWTNRGNWKTSVPLRDWHGVTTDAAGRVTQLDLGNNDLAGLIPPALGDLTSLRRLTLFSNALTGPIPDELGNLTRLRSLSLDSNELTGSIPARLGNLRLLEDLQLGRNALTGPIPDELGDLGALEGLGLSSNELTESIPAWLGNLWRLRWLDLQSNDFTGPIPGRLGSLVNLERLNLSYNWGLTGPLPPVGRFRRLGRADLLMTQACAPAGWFDSETMLDLRARPCETDPDVTIDVAIFHTPGAREAAGGAEGIAAAVDLMVAETNQAYAASGVRHRIRLVESSEVAYEETGNGHLDLGRFREPSDGHMDEVHVVRDRVGPTSCTWSSPGPVSSGSPVCRANSASLSSREAEASSRTSWGTTCRFGMTGT